MYRGISSIIVSHAVASNYIGGALQRHVESPSRAARAFQNPHRPESKSKSVGRPTLPSPPDNHLEINTKRRDTKKQLYRFQFYSNFLFTKKKIHLIFDVSSLVFFIN